MDISEYREEMLAALTANIKYLKQNGSSNVRIRNGRFVSELDSKYIYDFEIDASNQIEEENDVEVRIGQQSIPGKVTSIADNTVTIATEADLGENIGSAILIISAYFLLEKLHDHIQRIQDGELKSTDLSEKVFGLKSSSTAKDSNFEVSDLKLNESQENALKTSLGSEVTYIWGPPGTGKSETISRIVEALVSKNLSVLLIAHTNAATDSVMLKVAEWLESRKSRDYFDGRILRVGSTKAIDPELQKMRVVPHRIAEEKAKPILAELDVLVQKIQVISNKLKENEKVELSKQALEEAQTQIKRLKQSIHKHELNIEECQRTLKDIHNNIQGVEIDINNYQNKGAFSRLFSGENLTSLTEKKVKQLNEVLFVQEKILQLKKNKNTDLRKISTTVETVNKLIGATEHNSTVLRPVEIKELKLQQKRLGEQQKALQEQLASLSEDLIANAKVIGTTLTKSYMHKPILAREYDCVIIDESSMAPLPAVLCASGLAKKKVILVGDFLQLPPIAKHKVDTKNMSDEEAVRETQLIDKWLRRDIFNVVGIDKSIRANSVPDKWLIQLNTQYRMHPDISGLVNAIVYARINPKFKLIDGKQMINRGLDRLEMEPLGGSHVGIYDTHRVGSLPVKTDSGSWYNLPHAIIAVELVKQALDSKYTSIGIISSYRAQVNLIQEILKHELSAADLAKVSADTVHRFQGGAKQIIIFDVTVPYTLTMYDDGKESGDDEKLINVAFSRAKEKCIVLMNVEEVEKKHSGSSLIRLALEYIKTNRYPIEDAKRFYSTFSASGKTDEWLAKLNNITDFNVSAEKASLFNQQDFYPALIKDLLNAEDEVIIQSAYITTWRSDMLKPVFNRLIEKGVVIYIMSRNPLEHDGLMRDQSRRELEAYKKMGIIVLPFRNKMHQKFAIIDRKILWDGSLNILSQRDSLETMTRFESEGITRRYMSFHRLEKILGNIGQNHLKQCESCKEPGAYYWPRLAWGRTYYSCLIGNHSPGQPAKPALDKEAKYKLKKERQASNAEVRKKITKNDNGQLICPVHSRVLEKKTHPLYGEYWACPNFKECSCTINAKQIHRIFGEEA